MKPSPIIDLQSLDFYYGTFQALREVSLSMGKGIYGLLGPNGAGKTTLLKILLGFLQPTRGSGTILGHELGGDNISLKRRIGYMPEIDVSIPGMDGITQTAYLGMISGMPRQEAMKRAHEVLYYVGLEDARYREAITYSSGMKQRLKLAGALVHDPELLFLDEPTSGMDPNARKEMLFLINDIAGSGHMDMVISSHILSDIETTCSDIIIVNKGRIIRHEKMKKESRSTNLIELQLVGKVDDFMKSLPSISFSRNAKNQTIAKIPSDYPLRRFFNAAVRTETQIRHLRPLQVSLEDRFVSAIGEDLNGN